MDVLKGILANCKKRTLYYKFIEIQGSYHPPFLLQAIVIVSTTAGSPEPALGLAWHDSLTSTILVSFPQPPLQSTLFSLHGTQQRHTPPRSHPFTTDLLCTPRREQATREIVFYYLHLSTAFCPVPAWTWRAPPECHSLFDFVWSSKNPKVIITQQIIFFSALVSGVSFTLITNCFRPGLPFNGNSWLGAYWCKINNPEINENYLHPCTQPYICFSLLTYKSTTNSFW